jgi:molybdopterin synthase catalytic subunit
MTTTRVVVCQVTPEPLNGADHERAVATSAAGAVATFVGLVRDHDHGRPVVALDYEAHPSAHTVLQDVLGRFSKTSRSAAIAVSHRVGALSIGDAALVVSVSSAHRGVAFEECAQIVDLVKEHLPVWKHQFFADGSEEWVNCA